MPVPSPPLGAMATVVYRVRTGPGRCLESVSGDCRQVLGVEPDRLLAEGIGLWRRRIPAAGRQRNRRELRRALRARERFVLAYRIREADGSLRWLAETGVGRWDAQGRLVAVEGLVVDLREMAGLVGLQQRVSESLAALLAAADELAGLDDLDTLCRRAVELAREKLGIERCGLFLLGPDGQHFRGTYGTSLERETTDERASRVTSPQMVELLSGARAGSGRLWQVILEQPYEWHGEYGVEVQGPPVWVALTPLQTGRVSIGFMSNDRAISRGPLDDAQQDLLAVYCTLLAGLIERQQALDALRRQQAESRDLVFHSTNALALYEVVLDADGQPADARILMANPRFEELTGLSEVVGRLASEVLPEDPRPYLAHFWPVVQTGQPQRVEIPVAALGRVFDVTAFRPRPGCFAVSFKDITDSRRRVAEQQLNEARLDALLRLNQMAEADDQELCLFALGQGVALTGSQFGYLAFANDDESVLTMHAWSDAAMAECSVRDIVLDYPVETTGLWGEPVRQRRVVITNEYRLDDPLVKGTPLGHVPVHRHMGVPVFDGERIVAVCGVANKAEPYADDDARQLSLLMGGMWRVLRRHRAETDLRRAEADLRRSEERYRLLFDHAPVGIIQYDTDGIIERANTAFGTLLGTAPEALLGMSLLDHPDESIRGGVTRVLTGHSHTYEGEQRSALAGRPVQVRTLSHPLRHEDGSLLGGMTLAEDISQRLQLEERLRQSSKMEAIGRLAGGVAHDFNNLLTTIVGYTELALSGMHAGDPLRGDLEAISRAAERANSLTRQLLAFSRRQALSPQPLDLNALVQGMVEMVRPLIGEDIELSLDLADDLAAVTADPSGLEQVLMNLCVNARDAMPDGGQLTIATRGVTLDAEQAARLLDSGGGTYVLLTVRDTGCGMDEATLSRVFEPFFSTKERGKGTGLGLATTYGIVHQSQGSIIVESEPGQGALFSVYLPASAETVGPDGPQPADARQAVGQAAGLVLLVEDQPEVRGLAKRILESHGYHVVEAEDGQQAIERLSELVQPIDLLLTDVVMPRMGGLELARRLRAERPDLPILYVSGYTDSALARDGATEPGTAFLPKPYSPSALAACVRDLLSQSAHAASKR